MFVSEANLGVRGRGGRRSSSKYASGTTGCVLNRRRSISSVIGEAERDLRIWDVFFVGHNWPFLFYTPKQQRIQRPLKFCVDDVNAHRYQTTVGSEIIEKRVFEIQGGNPHKLFGTAAQNTYPQILRSLYQQNVGKSVPKQVEKVQTVLLNVSSDEF